MSFCVNPNCPHPKNPNNIQVCQACGSSLRLNGRYQTLGLLGKGGFGATFAAADVGLPGTPICVVKQLRPQTDDPNVFRMAKELFEREAQTLGRVGNHPQVPRLLDYFEDDQQFYLVQEYVKGHNLHQEVKKNGTFTEGSVKQFLTEILPILDYIHSQKVIHRDIKPANLIRRQTDQKLVLIDFGAVKNQIDSVLASNTSAQTALTAFAVGTAGFAPPEQMAMRPVYASDIYATGVTCLYLLTGKTPKEIDCNSQTGEMDWEKHVTVSSKFAEIIRKMLELSVRHRYKSAQQVLDALEMLPYEDGMMQGMVSTPFTTLTGAGNEPVTGIRTGNNSPSDYGEPSTRLNTSVNPKDPSSTSLNTGIKTRTAKPPNAPRERIKDVDSPTTRVRPASNPGGAAGAPGSIDYNMASQRRLSRREEDKPAIANQQEIKRWNSKNFLAEYAQGKRDFADQNLVGIILAKAFVPGINCYQANLTNANFEQAELTRADFGKARLKNAILKDANLSDAYFGYADLRGADLRGANLSGVNFKYANLQGANFSGADLGSAKVSPEQLKLAKTNWRTVMPGSGRRR
ncbi:MULTISPECIES: serine/threonine-protein kinase [unclassified Synechocystis]|uniref:serine/threonine-protein kinase SpkB n=1 Tax=unclassified Synechocystis TaxID=2640012 RepID=UPI0003F5B062|nr:MULTISPECIES: serine/threonine-protein kinase [unclassified Synechocystis]AIE74390.1 Serine/threonine kinase [Synechocystis sp. PCC 6714]MCT0254837.1 pentapeptide repeat-containing protein [Synechocystis sp. CS-94]